MSEERERIEVSEQDDEITAVNWLVGVYLPLGILISILGILACLLR